MTVANYKDYEVVEKEVHEHDNYDQKVRSLAARLEATGKGAAGWAIPVEKMHEIVQRCEESGGKSKYIFFSLANNEMMPLDVAGKNLCVGEYRNPEICWFENLPPVIGP